MADLVGYVVEEYRIEEIIGDGGMGTVYKAYDTNLDRPVALKIMHPHYARRSKFRARLRQEAKTLAALDHPSIVRVLDYGETDELAYIVMEHIGGGSLRAHLHRLQTRQRFLPLEQGVQIGYQIAEALQYAHAKGMIHRDVKPSNIILKRLTQPDERSEQPFRAVLTDFGLVKLLEGVSLTQSGTTLGTPTYMSPEQCEGLELDGRSDIYSLGVVLYEVLTNRLPYVFNSLAEAIAVHMRGEMPPPVREHRPEIPAVVDAIVTKALAKDPASRFANGEEMATALRSAATAMAGRPTQVIPRPTPNLEEASLVDEAPPGFELLMRTPGFDATRVELTQPEIALGRDPDNDIVLPAEGVSRRHARLIAGAAGWRVLDLGGINGTWLNGERLPANEQRTLQGGDSLKLGPYELELIAPPLAAPPVPISPTPTPHTDAELRLTPLLELFLPRTRVTVAPGHEAEFQVEIANRSSLNDRVVVIVEGLPEDWVEGPDGFVPLEAGETIRVALKIRPPAAAATPAGRQPFRLRVRSQQFPNAEPEATASLMLGAFEAFEASLSPARIRLPDTVQVMITNTGNATSAFRVSGLVPYENIEFIAEEGLIRLEPRQRAIVEVQVQAKSPPWFGAPQEVPFEIEVGTSNRRQALAGVAELMPVVPPWLAYSGLVVAVFTCVLAFLFLAFGDTITRTGSANAAATSTALAAADLQTIVAARATIEAATQQVTTPQTAGDADGDGLSDAQEALLRTLPDEPDSDGDGLLDGPEVLTHGCNPLDRDSDQDGLNDWDEINVYKTRCDDADTDDDGFSDGVEIANGTDPLTPAAATPTPSATGTQAPPSATFTPSLTPSATATNDPTMTPSASPSATPTQPTSTASATATQPTSTATATATGTASATPSPTASPTSTPEPALACTNDTITIDGQITELAWATAPEIEFGATTVSLLRDGSSVYMAFVIDDATNHTADSVMVYFDTNGNGGDPDDDDRLFTVNRDGTSVEQRGDGTNGDGAGWQAHSGAVWDWAVAPVLPNFWVVEIEVDAVSELNGLANPYNMMLRVFLNNTTEERWPAGANTVDANTWEAIENPACP